MSFVQGFDSSWLLKTSKDLKLPSTDESKLFMLSIRTDVKFCQIRQLHGYLLQISLWLYSVPLRAHRQENAEVKVTRR